MKTKIFVDGNCIVCDLEISHYKRIAPEAFDPRYAWAHKAIQFPGLHALAKIGYSVFVVIRPLLPKKK